MDFLEYSDITCEIQGSMTPGKIKMTDQAIIFKNSKTGKVEQIQASEMEQVNFQNYAGSLGMRLFLKNGMLYRFSNFKDSDKDKILKYFNTVYKKDLVEKDLGVKGWNWGTAKFNGSVLSFDVGHHTAFEIPLNNVSQCLTGKNEITMEFHQNDDAPVSLMEMRLFIPANELAGDMDPVDAFQQQVMNKASVINISGDAIAIFREIQCLTPRGRYDIKVFQTFFQLHGKTFDYKIPMSTVLRLFMLPHKDMRQNFFVVSLDPPIKQGQTRYHFLVLQFRPEEETSVELPFTEEELKEKYQNKLEKEISGPTHEVIGKVMKVILNRKIIAPSGFIGHSGSPAVGCSFKAAAGYLYPLERGFIYIHKPPIHIRFEEINSVNFARGGGSTRSFDFEIELKSGTQYTFSSIEKEEYGKLFDFITSKKLNVKNRGKNDKASYKDDFGDSDDEKEPDAYLERVKAEAQERDSDNEDDDESTDEDFNPDQGHESDVAEEYDSNHSSTSSDSEGDGAGASAGSDDDSKAKKHKKHKKEKKQKKAKTVSEKPRKKKTGKKETDDNRPKRPTTAFMLWLNETREEIKKDNPGVKVTEIAKIGGEKWKDLKDKSEWEKKAAKAKEDYLEAMKEYEASVKENPKSSAPAKKKSLKPATVSTPKSGFKSKEYIESDGSSNSEDDDDKDEVKKKSKKATGSKRKASDDEDKSKKAKTKNKSESDDDRGKKSESKKKTESRDTEDKNKKSKSKKKSESEEEKDDESDIEESTSEENEDSE